MMFTTVLTQLSMRVKMWSLSGPLTDKVAQGMCLGCLCLHLAQVSTSYI